MLPVFCQVNMTKKVTQDMLMHQLVFNKNISKGNNLENIIKGDFVKHQISKL